MDNTLVIVGAIVVLVVIALLIPVFRKARNVNLTETKDGKPEWMRTTLPAESQAATESDGQGTALYGHDAGEKLASPFAEQIEDILQAKIKGDAHLSQFEIDLGSDQKGSLEIWVDGNMYSDIDSLPDERLKQAFKEAIEIWEKG